MKGICRLFQASLLLCLFAATHAGQAAFPGVSEHHQQAGEEEGLLKSQACDTCHVLQKEVNELRHCDFPLPAGMRQ